MKVLHAFFKVVILTIGRTWRLSAWRAIGGRGSGSTILKFDLGLTAACNFHHFPPRASHPYFAIFYRGLDRFGKVNVNVAGFPLTATAKKRVQAALKAALEKELKAVGETVAGIFGDGSVKGKTAPGGAAGGPG